MWNFFKPQKVKFEQYKLAIDAAEKITDRRNQSNTLYMTVVSLIPTAIALSFQCKPETATISFFQFCLAVLGLLITFIWIGHMAYYKKLIKIKFTAVTELETYLELIPLYKNKDIIRKDISVIKGVKGFSNNSDLEKMIPIFFSIFFLALTCWLGKKLLKYIIPTIFNYYIVLIIFIIFVCIGFTKLINFEAKVNYTSETTKDEDELIKERLNFKNYR